MGLRIDFFYAGDENVQVMDLKKRSAEALWTYGKTWLHREIENPS